MAFDAASSDRVFHLHMADGSAVTLLPTILRLLAQQAPHLRLEVSTLSRSTATALRTGDADLAIGYAPGLDREFRRQSLYSQDWVCLVRSGHAATRRFGVAEYEAAHHVDISRRTWSGLLASTLHARDVRRHVTLQLPGVLGLVAVLTAGDLVATLPRHISQTLTTFATVEIVECPVPIPSFVLNLYWHAHHGENAGNAWLRGIVAGAFSQYAVS
jgi:DNA-binding transcriptional LysR family regulator